MGTFYSKNDYRNYLAHYGVKGMNRPSGLKYKTRKKTFGMPRPNGEDPFNRPSRPGSIISNVGNSFRSEKPDIHNTDAYNAYYNSRRPSSSRPDADAHQRDNARRQEQNRLHSQLDMHARSVEHMRGNLLKNRIAQLREDNARRHKVEEEKRRTERRRRDRHTVSNWRSGGYGRRPGS